MSKEINMNKIKCENKSIVVKKITDGKTTLSALLGLKKLQRFKKA